jgi:tetratricopeptide (TPR) repeat protein
LKIREKALGPEHPAVAQVLQNLAKVYFQQHRYGEAEALYGRAVAIMEKRLGPDHPDLAHTLNRYALLLQETKRKSEASTMKARAKAILTNNSATRIANQTVDVRDLDRKWEPRK